MPLGGVEKGLSDRQGGEGMEGERKTRKTGKREAWRPLHSSR